MAEIAIEAKSESPLDTRVGAAVVLLATFLGICNVKGGNIAQQMQQKQADRNNSWAWYQARNLREAVYDAASEEMSVPRPHESTGERQIRETKSAEYHKRAEDQKQKKEDQKAAAEQAEAEYKKLAAKDDQFDLCEAALTIGLAMMGVTVLIKKKWLFWIALIPSVIGLGMGIAGFLGADTDSPAINWAIHVLS